MSLVIYILTAASSFARTVTLSNVALPLDQRGEKLLTGEASVLHHEGNYYFYFNNWGTCPGVDCCASSAGCASCCFHDPPGGYLPGCGSLTNGSDPYGIYHTVEGYRTADFETWTYMGEALPLASRAAVEKLGQPGIEFRPCVVYSAATKLFVMWYEDRGATGGGAYQVATSPTPEGPFVSILGGSGDLPGKGRAADYSIFVDDDAKAYHVRTGIAIVELDATYTKAVALVASFRYGGEGPTMFKRNGTYYVTAGKGCCACIGGSNVDIFSAPAPAGPWTYAGDVGSKPGVPFNPHSKDNYVTNAQGSATIQIGEQFVYLGNQWNTGLKETRPGPGPRNHDLLFWGLFDFLPAPGPASGVVCEAGIQVHKGGAPLTFACAAGAQIDRVNFAAFGTPSGSCGNTTGLRHNATCDAANATALVAAACVGEAACTVNPSVALFGDPCVGTVKHFVGSLRCAPTAAAPMIAQLVWTDTVAIEI